MLKDKKNDKERKKNPREQKKWRMRYKLENQIKQILELKILNEKSFRVFHQQIWMDIRINGLKDQLWASGKNSEHFKNSLINYQIYYYLCWKSQKEGE